MKIAYYIRAAYGTPYIYIADAEQAKHVAALTHHKTIDADQLKALQSLGFEVEQIPDPQQIIKL